MGTDDTDIRLIVKTTAQSVSRGKIDLKWYYTTAVVDETVVKTTAQSVRKCNRLVVHSQ